MEADSSTATVVLVSVADTGVGIAPEEQEKIFGPFYRAENPLEVEASGVGVGLTIARSLVEAHGGRMWVESEPGQGSVFYFTLPLWEKEGRIKDGRLWLGEAEKESDTE
jgi:signal transduction histidine kinase